MTGFTIALLMASAALVISAVSRLRVSCATLSQAECALEGELASEGAKVEGFTAFGCLTAGAGLLLHLRRARRTGQRAT